MPFLTTELASIECFSGLLRNIGLEELLLYGCLEQRFDLGEEGFELSNTTEIFKSQVAICEGVGGNTTNSCRSVVAPENQNSMDTMQSQSNPGSEKDSNTVPIQLSVPRFSHPCAHERRTPEQDSVPGLPASRLRGLRKFRFDGMGIN